ncbi:DUF948 domain-containing protein [Paenibacillus sp. CMAA1364]
MMEISVLIIALAFAVLVVFLIKTLKAATQSLEKTTQILQEVKKTIDELGYEVKQTVRQANDITVDLQHKMKQIDPVMDSVNNLGEILSEITFAGKQVASTLMDKITKSKTKSTELVVVPPTTMTEGIIPTTNPINKTSKLKDVSWLRYVDVAADVWKKFR